MSGDLVILVDDQDVEIGVMDKLEAHEKALLHRAFSVIILNDRGEMLLQQRSPLKYHSGGLWTNACCSHPKPGELVKDAAHRRLQEELGFNCELKLLKTFIYQAPFDNGLTEHELDHVFVGNFSQIPDFNTEEVQAVKWMNLPALRNEIRENPNDFTVWFKLILEKFESFA